MTTKSMRIVRNTAEKQKEILHQLKVAALVVPIIAFLCSLIAMPLDLRFGFFAVPLILGWTQVVGL